MSAPQTNREARQQVASSPVQSLSESADGPGHPALTWYAFRVLQRTMEQLPRGLAYALAIAVARIAYLTAGNARRALTQNLGAALPDASPRELRRVVRRNFRNHSKAYADLMRLPVSRVADLKPLLRSEGWEHLEAARAQGRGVLMVSCHMGSWEIAAAIWAATVAPVNLFAEVLEPPEMYDWYRTTRARLGISVLPLNRAGLRQVLQALDANEIVVTAIDRDITGTGIPMELFGRCTRIPDGPAAIALRRGTPIIPVCVYRLPDDTFHGIGYEPIRAEATGSPRSDIERTTRQLVSRIEAMIREHPDQWHMPHRIWQDPSSEAAPRSGRS